MVLDGSWWLFWYENTFSTILTVGYMLPVYGQLAYYGGSMIFSKPIHLMVGSEREEEEWDATLHCKDLSPVIRDLPQNHDSQRFWCPQ